MSRIKVTLQCMDSVSEHAAAYQMHRHTLTLPVCPRPGDLIKGPDHGYAEVTRVVFDGAGDITLIIQ